MSAYTKERAFISSTMRQAYDNCFYNTSKTKIGKGFFDIVTPLDTAIEAHIIDEIHKNFPDDTIISEETQKTVPMSDRTWTIDPIDGTFNMANNSPLFGIQCALLINKIPVVSAVFLPRLNEMYSAEIHEGATVNGRDAHVSDDTDFEHAIISFGDFRHDNAELSQLQLQMISRLSARIAKIRMFGAGSFDFSCVANARTMGTVLFTKNVWDVAPGLLICSEAGATLCNQHGTDYTWDDDCIIATASPYLSDIVLDSTVD